MFLVQRRKYSNVLASFNELCESLSRKLDLEGFRVFSCFSYKSDLICAINFSSSLLKIVHGHQKEWFAYYDRDAFTILGLVVPDDCTMSGYT